jgi:predicted glutamine amidotransferase
MCRLLGYCSHDAASVAELLGTESFRAFTSLSDLHGDGWGMAWYAGSRPAVWKSAARAGSEPEYDKLAWQPLGDLGLVHLRWATPGLAVTDVNTHPFRYGDYTFAHNGAIHPQERLGEMLPLEWERRLAGSTDSERYFLHVMWRLAVRDGDMVAAIADTTAAISQRYTTGSLNAILLAPDRLYAISFYDRSMVPADRLRERGHGDDPKRSPPTSTWLTRSPTTPFWWRAPAGRCPAGRRCPRLTCWSPTGARSPRPSCRSARPAAPG